MKKLSAFIDESGDPRYGTGTSETLAYCCVLVERDKIEEIENKAKEIRMSHGLTQFKSADISNEGRRIKILSDLVKLDLKYLWLNIEKSKVVGDWCNYPKSFYKYTQKILHRELYRLYAGLEVTIDKFGTPRFQESLKNYIERDIQMSLFDGDITIGSAKQDVLIQVADFLAGTRRKLELNEFQNPVEISDILSANAFLSLHWPTDRPEIDVADLESADDLEIAKLCLDCAQSYIDPNRTNHENRAKVLLLEYLLFTAKYSDPKGYVLSQELRGWLEENGFEHSEEEFRSHIVGNLRDEGVIIGSSRKGLKIPLTASELIDFINESSKRYIPMIRRSRRAIETLKARSFGSVDLLADPQFAELRKVIEAVNL
ncbi:MAG: DUF3800 domain-containing protein [Desulfobacteraceae bacterium]|nr:DUF3800 domain-containing protein [Desulfobacteraceae bacterium]